MINHLDKLNGSKVLVTGGLGFVGHNLVIDLIDNYNCKVIVIDDCSNSDESVLGSYINKVEFHKISVLDDEAIFPLIERVEYVFHLACKQISSSGREPNLHLDINARSTLNILEFLRHNELKNFKRFLYTSSASIYGSSVRLPISEENSTAVLSSYAATKLLGENFTLMYYRNYDVPTSCVRYSNVYGYGQTSKNEYCGVIGKFIDDAMGKNTLTVIGDGEQTRDYTFITDAIQATLITAVHPKAVGDVFNIGTTVETSVNELVKYISAYIPEVSVSFAPERDIDNIRRRLIDITKIHTQLGWSPLINMKEGIRLTIEELINK